MTGPQAFVFAVLGASLFLFAWGRWRYDLVAVGALVAVVVGGVVPASEALLGFGHPAVATVAAVLAISRGLRESGVVERVARLLRPLAGRPAALHIAVLTGLVTLCSGFMNNVGALALLLPVAIATAREHERSPALLLMPLSFGSILGGLTTMIGTPPNIIVATYRAQVLGAPFGLFDFLPVGGVVAVCGVAFIAILGWRLIPKERRGRTAPETLFEIGEYLVEVRVREDSGLVGQRPVALQRLPSAEAVPVGLLRGGDLIMPPPRGALRAGDVLVLKTNPQDLDALMGEAGLELTGAAADALDSLKSEDSGLVEAVVTPGSRLEGRGPYHLYRRSGGTVVLLALARQDRPIRGRPWAERFRAGDVLLLQASRENLADTLASFGLLPLAERDLQIGQPRRGALALGLFAAGLLANLLGLVPITLAFLGVLLAYAVLGVLPMRDLYREIDWPVIVLLGAMIPVGGALEASGGTALLAGALVEMAGGWSPLWVLTLLLVVTMFVSDLINNAATALVMAPIAVQVAQRLGVASDPFLMAVALGASCAFLTPIGHQSNILVMGPGGYKFGDYWRMGLPLELLITAVAVPLIAVVWPLR